MLFFLLKINRKDYTQLLIDAQSDDFKIEDYNASFNDNYNPSQIEKKLTYEVYNIFLSLQYVDLISFVILRKLF